MNNKFENFKIISEEYLSYLRKYDKKVPTNNYDKYDKFFFGVVLKINNLEYYVPVSSFNKAQATNIPITDSKGVIKSTLRFCFMLPIPNENVLSNLNLENKDNEYINLVNIEYEFCKNNIIKIVDKAKFIYDKVADGIPFYVKNCCDFKLLEQKCNDYQNIKSAKPLDLFNNIKNKETKTNTFNFSTNTNQKDNNEEKER